MFIENLISRSEFLNKDSISTSGAMDFDFGSITIRTSSADSSRTSPTAGIFFAWIIEAMRSISFDFLTWYGISVMTACHCARPIFSTDHFARSRIVPRPVR